ncbi:Protein pthb1-like protein [Diplonema papillatum]|nr:Protein pthb1-like protein [Diplonema papillatum]
MGSLFKARDWWQTRCGENEEFDRGCLVVANVDNDPSGSEKLVVGSFQGVLRIYHPRQKGFKADDLLLEQQLDGPILQLATGRFSSNASGNVCLAVLHSKRLTVYNVQRHETGAGEGSHDPLGRLHTLVKQYDHNLDRVAFNFIHGPFGGAPAHKDHICVQTMDGQLNFFEQEKFYFSRFLSNPQGLERAFLLPGVLCYHARMDSFLTSTSTFDVECYRYATFVSSNGSQNKEGTEGRKLRCDWSVNLGEDVVDIRIVRFARQQGTVSHEIAALCDRSIYILKENGEIRQQRRLDYFPSTMLPYIWKTDDKVQNLIIGTHTASIMIYNDQKLIWSAKTNTKPISLAVTSQAKLAGLIVILSEDGSLSCNYLGTDPATQPTQLLDTARELDYDDMDEEHRQLQQLIRQAVNAGKSEPEEHLQIQYECPSQLDSADDGDSSGKSCTVKVFLKYSGKEDLENVALTVNCPQPFVTPESSIAIDRVEGQAEPQMIPITFMLSAEPAAAMLTPASLQAEVTCCYCSPTGEPLTARRSFFLPMSLAGSVIPPVKNPNFKITLETNLAPPPLQVLFDDITAGSSDASMNVLSFQYNNSSDVTILVSKSANRFRIQASHFESLWLLTAELARRVKIYYDSQDTEPLKINFQDALPFQDYFQAVDTHFEARMKLQGSQQKLSEMAHQFRSIQKRLLVRFKDRNPSPLNNLDKLFENTYRQLLKISEVVESDQQQLQRSSNGLVCSTHLILLLIQYRFDKKDDIKVLRHYLSPIVMDSATQGWEESTDAAMTHLLRTSLAKTYKEAMSLPQPLQVPPDTTKLKKHIALVCDRLAKGGSLKNDKPPPQAQKEKSDKPEK